jgi:hypothetical protein
MVCCDGVVAYVRVCRDRDSEGQRDEEDREEEAKGEIAGMC